MLQKISLTDQHGDVWVTWASESQLKEIKSGSPDLFEKKWIVAFHYFLQHAIELTKWINLLEKLAKEYVDRIYIAMRDINTIQNFNGSLDAADFGSYRSDVPPRVYGMECNNRVYSFHMLFNQKYLKDFCDRLINGQMFQAVVLEPSSIVNEPRNYFDLENEMKMDFLVMLYDPACYYWSHQLGMLRKLSKLLAHEEIRIVLIDKSKNYLGVNFSKWSNLVRCHGCIGYTTWRQGGFNFNFSGRQDSTREYLKLICRNIRPELKDYNASGEPRALEQALDYIRFLFNQEYED